MDSLPISRIAPTPSGYLHLGNAINFIITWLEIKKLGGKLILRIDDLDAERSKDEYIEDVFETLSWLQIDYDEGPETLLDFKENYSQKNRIPQYIEGIYEMRDNNAPLFNCNCSRSFIKQNSLDGKYPGTCHSKIFTSLSDDHNVRLKAPDIALKDFVIFRKDKTPSYQLASVIDDIQMKVNLIIRGEDLADSTQAQLQIANYLSLNSFSKTIFRHHPLIKDKENRKLSKSDSALSIKEIRKTHSPSFIYKHVSSFLKLENSEVVTINELLELCETPKIL